MTAKYSVLLEPEVIPSDLAQPLRIAVGVFIAAYAAGVAVHSSIFFPIKLLQIEFSQFSNLASIQITGGICSGANVMMYDLQNTNCHADASAAGYELLRVECQLP